ncbi:uncharacterized protein BDV17DRAFT_252552 [Aspergillus undulatus]|uniref:uncharacterized protein n=1 Tax=Aspergillus undulatus TaxID=1810928 RepID=UPI003CCD1F72
MPHVTGTHCGGSSGYLADSLNLVCLKDIKKKPCLHPLPTRLLSFKPHILDHTLKLESNQTEQTDLNFISTK